MAVSQITSRSVVSADKAEIRQIAASLMPANRGRSALSWIALAAVLILGTVTAAAQQTMASIRGTVTDLTGARIAKAKVVIQNEATHVQQSTVTTGSGTYAVSNLAPGSYTLTVTKPGFKPLVQHGILLQVAQAVLLNYTMQVGNANETVTVQGENTGPTTTTASLGAVINNKEVTNLPLNGRNFTQLLELTPGVSRISVGQNKGSGTFSSPIGTFTFPSVNGQENRSNTFYLDGGIDLEPYMATYNYAPIVDDIQEFKVQSHSDLAEFGQVTGGIVTVATKSGTNSYHGDAWEFARNSLFNATDHFTRQVNKLRFNQFGGTLGGPLTIPRLYNGKNRTFFFFAFEGYRASQNAQSLLTTPTPAQLKGDFSNLLAKGIIIYNPFSTRPDPAHPGEYLRDPFPGNQIPATLLSSASLTYAKALFPAPTVSLPGGNVYNLTPTKTSSDSYTGRIDENIGAHDMLYGRVSEYDQPYSSPTTLPGTNNENDLHGYNITVHEVHTLNETSLVDLHFTRNWGVVTNQLTFQNAPSNFAQTLISSGFSGSFLNGFVGPISSVIPSISIPGYLGVGTPFFNGSSPTNNYEFGGAYEKTLGRHSIKAGVTYDTNNFSVTSSRVIEATSPFQTSNLEHPRSPTGAATGDAMASFLLGLPFRVIRGDQLEQGNGGYVLGAYAQDQFQVLPKLTLNLGVRYDVTVWPSTGYGNTPNGFTGDLDLSNGTYLITAVPPACSTTQAAPCIPGGTLPAHVVVSTVGGVSLHHTDYSNWQGRFGFAYLVHPNLTIHGGYGRYYDEWVTTQIANNAASNWPAVGNLTQNTLNRVTPTAPIGDPLHLSTTTIAPAATPFGNAAYYYNPYFKEPFSDQWEVGLDQGFGQNITLSMNYVGSHSSNLDLGGLHNTAEFPAPGTAAQVASRRQYPYITPTNYDNSTGNSNYNALQAFLTVRNTGGLTSIISYTWSKAIDLACDGYFGVEGCLLQNPYDPQADRSVAGFDLPTMISAAFVYAIPFGPDRRFQSNHAIVNQLLGGWQVNVMPSYTSGIPFSVTVSGDIANTGNTFVQANLVGTPYPLHRTSAEWFNTASFVSPPRYSFGTFGRNALRSDSYKNLDLSLFKYFPVTRYTKAEFRAEAFDGTNTQGLAAPNSGVGSPTFGAVSGVNNSPREIQLALKFLF